MTRDKIISVARSYIGVPFVRGGRSPIFGFDCWGFLQRICHDLNIPCANIPQSKYKRPKFYLAVFDALRSSGFNRIKIPQSGDLLIRIFDKFKGHSGILVDDTIIQSTDTKICETKIEGQWTGFEFPGVG